jgi:hypothetical protein
MTRSGRPSAALPFPVTDADAAMTASKIAGRRTQRMNELLFHKIPQPGSGI